VFTRCGPEKIPVLSSERLEQWCVEMGISRATEKEKVLGQFFTKEDVAKRLIRFALGQKNYPRDSRILEPSFGRGSFIKALASLGFNNISGCEIDNMLTDKPADFFSYPLSEKFDLIIGNPPFTKYNVEESYYHRSDYEKNFAAHPGKYLAGSILRRKKERIENAFIMKSLSHLKNRESSIGFILPVSFFIKDRNKCVKTEIAKRFSTVVVYQESKAWFDYRIPCCFAFFTSTREFKNKIVLVCEGKRCVIDKSRIHDEIIPQVFFNRRNGVAKNCNGTPLARFLEDKPTKYRMSYTGNNVSAANILERATIPEGESTKDYKLAIVRAGNASVGRCGLINPEKDVLNAMFFVFGFSDNFNNSKETKERICYLINQRQDYFKNITCRVGSKSIKRSDVLGFKIDVKAHGRRERN
jgi:hypothetical protein